MRPWNIPGPIATTSAPQLLVTNQQMLDQVGAVSVTVFCTVPWGVTNNSGVDDQYANCANKYPANVPVELNHRTGDLYIVSSGVGVITASINSVP
jgi:hypothetical protein